MIKTPGPMGKNLCAQVLAAAFCVLAPGAAFAQVSFDEGSFDEGSFGEGSPAPSGDDVAGAAAAGAGGSFGDDDFPTGPGGGGQPAPGVAPAPDTAVLPVQPAPPQPAPQPQPPVNAGIEIDPQIVAFEMRDFGVPPTDQLRQGQFHAPTPTSIPGGRIVSTAALADAMNAGVQLVLIDVLGGTYALPQAYAAGPLASPGHYSDRTQQQATQWLGQVTRRDRDTPIVIYCSDPMCWLSYNGSLRTIAAGYRNVYWYRGGLQAWQMAGLPLYPAGL